MTLSAVATLLVEDFLPECRKTYLFNIYKEILTLDTIHLILCLVVAAQTGTSSICHVNTFLLYFGFDQHGHGTDYQGPTWRVPISVLIIML